MYIYIYIYRPSIRLSYNGNYPPENALDSVSRGVLGFHGFWRHSKMHEFDSSALVMAWGCLGLGLQAFRVSGPAAFPHTPKSL